jgi:hypothetical protein
MSGVIPGHHLAACNMRFDRHLAGAVPGYANGGVVAGSLVHHLGVAGDDAIEVRLHRPVPLDRDLSLEWDGPGLAVLQDAEVVATARVVDASHAVRGPVSLAAARTSHPVVPVERHPAPGCFVCGPANRRGLNLQPGAVDGHDLVATAWKPPAELADVSGHLPAAIVWGALDCPSWYGAARGAPALLGTITARQYRPVPAATSLVVSGWGVRRDGRKTLAGSAIHSVDGEPLAVASAIWIHPKEHDR